MSQGPHPTDNPRTSYSLMDTLVHDTIASRSRTPVTLNHKAIAIFFPTASTLRKSNLLLQGTWVSVRDHFLSASFLS